MNKNLEKGLEDNEFTLGGVTTLQDVARDYNVPYSTLHSRLKNSKNCMIEDVDFKKLGVRMPTLLSPTGVIKLIEGYEKGVNCGKTKKD